MWRKIACQTHYWIRILNLLHASVCRRVYVVDLLASSSPSAARTIPAAKDRPHGLPARRMHRWGSNTGRSSRRNGLEGLAAVRPFGLCRRKCLGLSRELDPQHSLSIDTGVRKVLEDESWNEVMILCVLASWSSLHGRHRFRTIGLRPRKDRLNGYDMLSI